VDVDMEPRAIGLVWTSHAPTHANLPFRCRARLDPDTGNMVRMTLD